MVYGVANDKRIRADPLGHVGYPRVGCLASAVSDGYRCEWLRTLVRDLVLHGGAAATGWVDVSVAAQPPPLPAREGA